jgi:hypothetical protein
VTDHHVESDGRLVEKQEAGTVEQARRQLAADALAQRKLAHWHVEEIGQPEPFGQLADASPMLARLDFVDSAKKAQAVEGRQVVPQLALLAEHRSDDEAQPLAIFLGVEPQHRRRSAGRREQSGEHLDGGRFARAVRPQKGQRLACLDGERYVPNRLHRSIAGPHQAAESPGHPLGLSGDSEGFRQIADDDGRHGGLPGFAFGTPPGAFVLGVCRQVPMVPLGRCEVRLGRIPEP